MTTTTDAGRAEFLAEFRRSRKGNLWRSWEGPQVSESLA
jgi:hypothetical protein